MRQRPGKSQRDDWEKRFGMSYAEWVKKQHAQSQSKPPNKPAR